MTAPQSDHAAGLVTLAECPPGLFLFDGRCLGLKSEYKTEAPPGSGCWWPDAYVASTGEFFVGGAETYAARASLMVEPIDDAMLVKLLLEHGR